MTLKIVYTDVDGTLVGARGSFFRTAEGATTLEPARALVALHDAGVPVVLVSGRTRPQLIQDSLLLGADGLIAELGGIVGWGAGNHVEVQPLPGFGAPASDALVERLCATFDVELYAPWHEGHEVDVLLRGHADPVEVDAWLATTAESHLRLRDNGLAGQRAHEATAANVFHLIPEGISKGAAVAWDLARRGIDPADALAVGDSASDLEMAAAVASFALVANALAHPSLPALADNVFVTQAAMGLGWAEAVLGASTQREHDLAQARPSYRAALREPGVALVCAAGVIGRVPESMTGICLVLISHARGGYGAGGLQVGLLGLLSAASAPMWGRLADRQGLRRILLFTGVAQAIALITLGPAARSSTAAGLVAAAAAGLVRPPIAGAVRARWAALDVGPRAVMQALESALTETVYMLGPVLLGLVLLFGSPGDGLLVSAVLVVAGCFAMANAPGIAVAAAGTRHPHPHKDIWGPLRLPALRLVSGVFFLQVIAMAGIEVTLTALCNNQGRPALSGPLIGVWALGSAIGGLLWGSRHHSGAVRVRFGVLGLSAGLLLALFAVSANPGILFAVALPAGLAIAPGAQTGAGILSRVIPGEQLVEAYGWSSAAAPALGAALGYAVGGVLVQHHGPQVTALVFAGIALLAPLLVALRRNDLPID